MIALVAVIILGTIAVCVGEVIGGAVAEWAPGAYAQWKREYERHREQLRSGTRDA